MTHDGRTSGWLISGCLVVLGCGGSWWGAATIAHSRDRTDREIATRAVADVASTLDTTMRRELDLARVGAAFVAQNPDVSATDLQGWTDAVQVGDSHPEVVSIGVVTPVSDGCTVTATVSFVPRASSPADVADLCRLDAVHESTGPRATVTDGFVTTERGGSARFVAWAPVASAGFVIVVIDPDAVFARSVGSHPGYWVSLTDGHTMSPTLASGIAADDLTVASFDLPAGWTATVGAPPASTGIISNGRALVALAVGVAGSTIAAACAFVLGRGRSRAVQNAADQTKQMHRQSFTDSLTGLPNRAAVMSRLADLMSRCRDERRIAAVLYIDLDDFKDLNDSFGHAAGDQLLASIGQRLLGSVRTADIIGRVGGDEFVIVLFGSVINVAPEVVAHRILGELRTPHVIRVNGVSRLVTSSASIGIAQGCGADGEDLLRDADLALYAAKAEGKDRYSMYAAEMHDAVYQRLSLGIDLRAAVDLSQFELWYQPIYRLDDLDIVGVEALLRWNHPRLGTVEPDRFIPILEHTRQIVEVGRWVLNEACRQTSEWRRAGHSIGVAVNVSARQLDDPRIATDVADALRSSGLEPSRLTVEVTETALIRNPAASAARLRDIKSLGVRIAIDDFGSGYSSLAYLRDFPVDSLKLDRCFIQAIHSSPESDALVQALVHLGHDLGLQTVAEGVETIEQLDMLRHVQVDHGQGFLLARPLAADVIESNILGEACRPTANAFETR